MRLLTRCVLRIARWLITDENVVDGTLVYASVDSTLVEDEEMVGAVVVALEHAVGAVVVAVALGRAVVALEVVVEVVGAVGASSNLLVKSIRK